MSNSMCIRPAAPFDATEIESVRIRTWQAAYKEFMPAAYLAGLNPTANIEALSARLRQQDVSFSCLVAEDQRKVLGFSIIGTPRFPAEISTVELWALNVAPEAWRRGIGHALLQRSLDLAKEQGGAAIKLWCIRGNEQARRMYEASGFIATGEQRMTFALTGHPLQELCYAFSFA